MGSEQYVSKSKGVVGKLNGIWKYGVWVVSSVGNAGKKVCVVGMHRRLVKACLCI